MSEMTELFVWWYVSGLIGACIIDHFERSIMLKSLMDKDDDTIWLSSPQPFWACFLFAFLGFILFAFGAFVLYSELMPKLKAHLAASLIAKEVPPQ